MKIFTTILLVALTLPLPACGKATSYTASTKADKDSGSGQAAASPATQDSTGLSQQQAEVALDKAPKIDPERAWRYNKEFVAIGARPLGSEGHKKAEDYIHAHLKGDQVEDDAFVQQTPIGSFPVRNIIAKYPGKKQGIIVIGSHYETNYPLPKTYVGANDGGSSTALLLEFANLLRRQEKNGPADGYSVWLVFTDGEEAMQLKWSNDSLYGSTHLVQKWTQDGALKNIRAFLLADMLGDADLNLEDDSNSSPQLRRLAYMAAEHYGYQSHMFGRQTSIEDDHIPFLKAGVPVMDFIDLNYGYNNAYHHTPEDTLDKLSPKSLEISGDVILGTVALLNAGAK